MAILPPIPRPQRRRIHKIIYSTRDKEHARRLMTILLHLLHPQNIRIFLMLKGAASPRG